MVKNDAQHFDDVDRKRGLNNPASDTNSKKGLKPSPCFKSVERVGPLKMHYQIKQGNILRTKQTPPSIKKKKY